MERRASSPVQAGIRLLPYRITLRQLYLTCATPLYFSGRFASKNLTAFSPMIIRISGSE
jgi:hypothetical protein